MNHIAIMQGRLSAPQGGRLQFFPEQWEAEFALAKKLGFNAIEWFLDRDIKGFDPIRDVWGRPEAVSRIEIASQQVPVSSVDCGRYKLFGPEAAASIQAFKTFIPLVAPHLSTKTLSVPLLEDQAPATSDEKTEAHQSISTIAAVAKEHGLKIALETEMPAGELAAYIDSCAEKNIGVSYDIGNCTSYGFDCPNDIKTLGARIFEVHVKDRKIGKTQSMLLGTGDADFKGCFTALKAIGYKGVLTIQAWRGEDYLRDAQNQLQFIISTLSSL